MKCSHFIICLLVQSSNSSFINRCKYSLLSWLILRENLFYFSYLQQLCQVSVNTSLLQQVVMNLLQVCKWKVILTQLNSIHHYFDRSIELNSSPLRFFVSLENLIHDHLQLDNSLLRTELSVIILEQDATDCESINLRVASFNSYLFRADT